LGEFTPLDGLAVIWLLVVSGVAAGYRGLGDRWWFATVVLFLGRWPWLLPGAPLAVVALASRNRRTIGLVAAGVLVGSFWVMGLSLGLGRFFGRSDPATRLRIITYNVDGDVMAAGIPALVATWRPDLLAIQECGDEVADRLRILPGYQKDLAGTCLISRYPIIKKDSLPRDAVDEAGGSAWVKRYRIAGPGGEFDLTNLHLDTPRKGFEALMRGDPGAVGIIRGKTFLREIESRLSRRWFDGGPGPRIVAGDFNMPSESVIFQDHWGDLNDAFERAGFGFGYTRMNGWIKVRIDHILTDDRWVVRSARVLPDYGSDHLGLMADVERRR
jgi:endonuclease/exonuclease/phosphatase (EEP) superfamily protein YafD